MLRLLTVALLASSATATFFTTSPVASTRWTAGESEVRVVPAVLVSVRSGRLIGDPLAR
jgi:hypothetical protein